MYALQMYCPRIAEGANHDGWVTLITGTKDEMEYLQERPMSDGRRRNLRIVEV